MRWVTVAMLCWLALMVGGCAPQPDVIATDDDNGGHVQLQSGQLFDIVLADDYDQTGCQWRKERNSDHNVVDLLGSRYEPDRKPPAGNGNGTYTARYRAQQQGTAQISVVESDNNDRVCHRFAVDVTVDPPSLVDSITSGLKQVLPFFAGVAVLVGTLGLLGRLLYRLLRHWRA